MYGLHHPSLADNKQYNHYRHEVLSFLYEKQRKVETVKPRIDKEAKMTKKVPETAKTNAA